MNGIKESGWYKKWRAQRKARNRANHPGILMVQTITMCNAACSCCPYPGLTRTKAIPHGVMEDDLFDKIVADARGFDLKRISPYWNNEPFLDPKFPQRLETLRSTFPRATLHVSTNGSRLEPELWPLVANCMDRLHISAQGGVMDRASFEKNFLKINYDNYRSNVEGFLKYLAAHQTRLKLENVVINNVIQFASAEAKAVEEAYWHRQGVHTNFGGFNSYSGTITLQPRKRYGSEGMPIYGCADKDRPLQAMHVLFDGSCVLCCNDWIREVVVGNARDESLSEIWNGPAYQQHVRTIYSGKCAPEHMCNKCDQAIR